MAERVTVRDRVFTGIIPARDIGLEVKLLHGSLVLHPPFKYALGMQAIESPRQTRERMTAVAVSKGLDADSLMREYAERVRKKEGSDLLLKHGGNSMVQNVHLYKNNIFTAKVPAFDGSEVYDVSVRRSLIPDEGFYRPGCKCGDYRWGDEVKGKYIIDKHVAPLILALTEDERSRLPAHSNITGLSPNQRRAYVEDTIGRKDHLPTPTLPFRFFNNPETLTEVLLDYYVNRRSQFDINHELLNRASTYTDEAVEMIEREAAQITVVRQNEKFKDRRQLSSSELRLYNAANRAREQVRRSLRHYGFSWDGYSLAFPGTEHQAVTERYRRGIDVREITTVPAGGEEELPGIPLIVSRTLQLGLAYDWQDDTDTNRLNPLLQGTENRMLIDPVTRKIANTRIAIPYIEATVPYYSMPKVFIRHVEEARKRAADSSS